MKSFKSLGLLLIASGLLLSGCATKGGNQGGGNGGGNGGGGHETNWYDDYVDAGYTLASSFPKNEVATFLNVPVSVIPDIEVTTECVYRAVPNNIEEGYSQYFDFIIKGDVFEDVLDSFDALNFDFYLDFWNGIYMCLDTTRTIEIDVGGYGDGETYDETSLTFYKVSDIFDTTLDTNSDWSEETKEYLTEFGIENYIPFMQFGESYEFYDYEDGTIYMNDYYYMDLIENYYEVLENNGYTYVPFDEETYDGDYYYLDVEGLGTIYIYGYWDAYGNNLEIEVYGAELTE